jgi:hypothetical protein
LIDNYSKDVVEKDDDEENVRELKVFDLKTKVNSKAVTVEYLGELKFKAS